MTHLSRLSPSLPLSSRRTPSWSSLPHSSQQVPFLSLAPASAARHRASSGVAFDRAPSSLAAYVAEQAGVADLLIIGPDEKGLTRDFSRRVNVGELVMQVARPVLLVPPGVNQLKLQNVVVGWKETREARRAISDALPLLKLARPGDRRCCGDRRGPRSPPGRCRLAGAPRNGGRDHGRRFARERRRGTRRHRASCTRSPQRPKMISLPSWSRSQPRN
jgi:hypothetical protein